MSAPLVTILIPARNEEKDIERCLRAVLAQDHPHDRMEIVLVDGASTDSTVTVASVVLGAGDIEWKVLSNPVGTTPSNLNAGLEIASGEVLCRVDARSVLPPEYVRYCVEVLAERPDIAVTGGAQVAIAIDDSVRSLGIARGLNNKHAMGRSPYRSGTTSRSSDTVYLGAFRTEQLRATGGWDEALRTNQDFELNRRLSRDGVVWFDARLPVGYVPRQTLAELLCQYHRFGWWKVLYWRHTGDRPRPRQWVLIGAVPALVLGSAVVLRRRAGRERRGFLVAVGAAVSLGLADARGASSDEDRVTVRLVAVTTIVTVAVGWLTGLMRGVVEHWSSPPGNPRAS